ncbi:MAG: lamin tail domain-containing protein [Anaerolineales bacterium]|nr:lamin tail domain-containing protein [Anaerolineales bacterium]
MKHWKRLLFYLILNVLVSACTVLAALFAWDQMRGPLPRGLLPEAFNNLRPATATPTLAPGETPAPQPTATEQFFIYQVQSGDTFDSIAGHFNMSVEELLAENGFSQEQPLGAGEVLRIPAHPKGTVIIGNVIGASDIESERVLLKHRGEGELSLANWRIEDSDGNVFIFPELRLFGGGAVNVHTRAGVNTVIDLYWGLDEALWKSGDTVILRDTQGNVRYTYVVP